MLVEFYDERADQLLGQGIVTFCSITGARVARVVLGESIQSAAIGMCIGGMVGIGLCMACRMKPTFTSVCTSIIAAGILAFSHDHGR